MYLKVKASGDLVEVVDKTALVDPTQVNVLARSHCGEELQEPEPFEKSTLCFPSGEALPRCWTDPDYPR